MGKRAEIAGLRAEVRMLSQQVAAAPTPTTTHQPRPAGQRLRARVRHRYGRQYLPLGVLASTEVAGAIAHAAHTGGAGAFAATVCAGGAWWVFRRWRLDRGQELAYSAACWTAGAGWLAQAAGAGATAVDTRLWVGGALLSVPWLVHHRVRWTPPAEEPDATIYELWRDRVACPNGPLPNSRLLEVHDVRGGWTATIEMEDGNVDNAISAVKNIGARLKVRVEEISIEPHPGGLHLARIFVQPDNPLQNIHHWPGPTLTADGVAEIGLYIDGLPVRYRHFRIGGGGVHDLFAGCTSSGKTELVKTCLAEERHSGVIVSYLLDPQRGQSYGMWKRRVHQFAGSIPAIREKLEELRRRMYARNELLSSIKWTDDQGREQEGIEDFTPCDPRHGLPLISVTIDEFQAVAADEQCLAYVEEMIEMSRKCGIKFRLLTPVPLLGSLGDSQRIKDAVSSGNVVVFRTANMLTGQAAFNGVMPVDPCWLPKEWPDGSTTSGLGYCFAPGADRPTTMRTFIVDDAYHWATTGEPAIEDNVIGEPETETDVDPAAGGDTPLSSVPDDDADSPETNLLARDRVLEWFGDGEPRVTIEATKHFIPDIAPRTVRKALRDLTLDGLLTHPEERGPYWISDAGRTELNRRARVA